MLAEDAALDVAKDQMLNHRLLTHAEEIALGQQIEAGHSEARDILITHNTRLVFAVARQYRSHDPALGFDDLIQEGMLGLIRAVDKYEWRRGWRFSTYARWWVRQAITRALANSGRIRISVHTRAHENCMTADARELARVVLDLDGPVTGHDWLERATVGEMTPSGSDTEQEATTRVLMAQIMEGVPELPRRALELSLSGMTRSQIAAELGVSHGYIWYSMMQARKALGVELEQSA